jgi:hypothetical protein
VGRPFRVAAGRSAPGRCPLARSVSGVMTSSGVTGKRSTPTNTPGGRWTSREPNRHVMATTGWPCRCLASAAALASACACIASKPSGSSNHIQGSGPKLVEAEVIQRHGIDAWQGVCRQVTPPDHRRVARTTNSPNRKTAGKFINPPDPAPLTSDQWGRFDKCLPGPDPKRLVRCRSGLQACDLQRT